MFGTNSGFKTEGGYEVHYGISGGLGGELKVGKRGNRIYAAVLARDRGPGFNGSWTGSITPSFGFNWVL